MTPQCRNVPQNSSATTSHRTDQLSHSQISLDSRKLFTESLKHECLLPSVQTGLFFFFLFKFWQKMAYNAKQLKNIMPHFQISPWSPWYNCTGWLGIKHQFTYLLQLCLIRDGFFPKAVSWSSFSFNNFPFIQVHNYHFHVICKPASSSTKNTTFHTEQHVPNRTLSQAVVSLTSISLPSNDTASVRPVSAHKTGCLIFSLSDYTLFALHSPRLSFVSLKVTVFMFKYSKKIISSKKHTYVTYVHLQFAPFPSHSTSQDDPVWLKGH